MDVTAFADNVINAVFYLDAVILLELFGYDFGCYILAYFKHPLGGLCYHPT